ncbi:MAG: cell division protein ZapA [Saprospiraceae bacterium]
MAGAEMSGMEDNASSNITVVIAGRPYPLKISANDEADIRRIVKEVNEMVNQFQRTYTRKDKQDCLAMAILTYAVNLHKSRESSNPAADPAFTGKIHQLDQLLDQYLHS